ncbi:MAG: outer membrane lipoprotein carrier protein [Elusimicrobia bacterium]|nr:MAG: outer membrane lipoprotein carrier protein [Elusimicrobiota bacterium]KAF0156822.1 MAG: outer membrane lipoprotein carrier protein [Elusimicrobiota bacterium]
MRAFLIAAIAACLSCPSALEAAVKKAAPAGSGRLSPQSVPEALRPAVKAEVEKSTATPSYTDQVLAKLMEWDSALTSLKAGFTQTVLFSEAGLEQKVEGTLSYLKPDRLRIEHRTPTHQIIVTDKKDIWIYKPADSQAVKTRWEDWKNLQNSGFSGIMDFGNYAELASRNKVTAVPPAGPGGMVKLILTPVDRSGLYTLTLMLSATDYFPARADLVVESAKISTVLDETERNAGLDEKLFDFTPPKGTEIINFKK